MATTRAARIRLGVLLVSIAVGGAIASVVLGNDLSAVRLLVEDAGAWAGLVFVALHVVISLVPVPRSLLAVLAGTIFGAWAGMALSLIGSVIAAGVTFTLARHVGREAVAQVSGPRTYRVERVLRDHGFVAVSAARLTPIAPFTVTNYAAGISSVRPRDYTASLVGLIPGSIAWATVGASTGRDAGTVTVVASVVIVLFVGAAGVWRRTSRPWSRPPTHVQARAGELERTPPPGSAGA
jgi:uncharacterized membrane protein YdjX (TVP38/TMEM64 family)